ncbi:FAD-dependent monooxygenase [Streptomyces sp. NPDC005728]|uniref:FAD-dependent oxidoreductase n=1 Tax=Streptomyces sp. NPDC005728 TaxID=3157054 RepID=UPI0033C5427B
MSLHAPVADGGGHGHGHAVVIGQSLAGLTAARALAHFMDRVTVIERDRPPPGSGRRRGVPQARHTHRLMTAAQQGLEQLFPGIAADLERAGAVRVRMPADMLLLGPDGWLPRHDTGHSMLSAGRDLIDAVVRDRLRAEPKVAFLNEHEVVALQGGPNDTVTGVWVRGRHRQAPGGLGPAHLISADFVVDASGHDSRAPQWLAALGYQPPRESVTAAPSACASAVFAPPVGHVADWKSLFLAAAPGDSRQGMLHPVEGGRWSVSLWAGDGEPPPTDHAGLLRAAGALRHPLLRDVIEAATPLGPVYGWTPGAHRWRRYEKLRRFPDRFLVVGDALATLDAAHGQGMTLAVECALVLDCMLTVHGTATGLSHRLRRALAHHVAPAWKLSARNLRAAGGNSDVPARPGRRRRWAARFGRRWAGRIAGAAAAGPHTATLLHQRPRTTAPPGTGPGPAAGMPPSTTHGPNARRRRPAAPPVPASGVGAGTPGPRPAGSSAQWPTTAPAGERRRP